MSPSGDWEDLAEGAAPWVPFAPDAFAAFDTAAALVWQATDPSLAELARRRIATLLRNQPAVDRPPAAAPPLAEEKAAALPAWATSPLFDDTERACLAFTEQFVMDVGGMTPELVQPVLAHFGDRVGAFVQALFLLDVSQRMQMVLERIFDRPAGVGPPARPGAGDVDLWGPIEDMLRVVARLQALDPVTTELVRLRGARQHQCRICQSRLSLSALDAVGDRAVLDQVDRYEQSELPEREKVALRLTDAVITQPSTVDEELAAAVRRHFSPAETVEIVCDVARNATNKVAVALGADAAVVSDGVEYFDVDDRGEVVADVDPANLRQLLGAGSG